MNKILIPAKAESLRCPRKNFILLPFISDWLKVEGRHQDAIVIYDSNEMKQLAESLGLHTFQEVCPNNGDEAAAYDCANVLQLDSFIRLPLTQPLRSHNLLSDMEKQFTNINLVVSVQRIPDRRLFQIDKDGKFIVESKERKGCMCNECLMIDGAAYLCKTDWAKRSTSNQYFWKEPFKYAINHAPFLDIDTEEDLNKFKTLKQMFKY